MCPIIFSILIESNRWMTNDSMNDFKSLNYLSELKSHCSKCFKTHKHSTNFIQRLDIEEVMYEIMIPNCLLKKFSRSEPCHRRNYRFRIYIYWACSGSTLSGRRWKANEQKWTSAISINFKSCQERPRDGKKIARREIEFRVMPSLYGKNPKRGWEHNVGKRQSAWSRSEKVKGNPLSVGEHPKVWAWEGPNFASHKPSLLRHLSNPFRT